MTRQLYFLILLMWACAPDPIPEPQATQLLTPSNLNICTTATGVNDQEKQVVFEWTSALNTDSYTLIVQNTITGRQYSRETSLLKENMILPSGAPYRWYVLTKSSLTPAVGKSLVWYFYLEGEPGVTYIPFPALLLQPENDSTVSPNANGAYVFQWAGKDIDNDISHYNLYLGNQPDELNLVKENVSVENVQLNLNSGQTYYWQVKTIDREGNSSLSLVYSFQTN